jgi:hypothetical protein
MPAITCPPNHEIFPYSNEYLDKLKTLAAQVSGDAPRPEPINIDFIKEIENKEGNERLLDILQQKDDLNAKFIDWSAKAILVDEREPLWKLLVDLNNHAPDEPEMEQLKIETAAIKNDRLLLQEPDLIQPLLTAITDKLLKLFLTNAKSNTMPSMIWVWPICRPMSILKNSLQNRSIAS